MLQTSNSKQFVTNTALVSLVQWTIQLLPFATLPILIKNLGMGGYGELCICLAFSAYVSLLVDFGFGWSATKQLASSTSSEDKTVIFWDVLYAKIALIPLSLAVPVCAYIFISSKNLGELVIFSCVLSTIGSVINTGWYLTATGRALSLSISTLTWRLLQLIFTVAFIKSEKDVWIAVALELFTNIFVVAYNYKIFREMVVPIKPSVVRVKKRINKSIAFFLSNAAYSFYSTINPIILAGFCNAESVGAYSIAEKLINAIKRSTHPIFQATYPRWIQLNKNHREQLHKETIVFLTGLLFWGASVWVGLLLFGNKILALITLTQIPESSNILSILSITPLLAVISHFAGYQILAPNNKEHMQTIIIALCGSVGLISSIILTSLFSTAGLAWSIVVIEVFIMFFMCRYAFTTYRHNNFKKG